MDITHIYRMFPTNRDCHTYLEQVRWQGKPICPYCQSDRTTPLNNGLRHHCNLCNTTFSVTVNTIFHHTHIPLQKWFLGIFLILNSKRGIAARQLARELEINKNSAWYLVMRIHRGMNNPEERKLLQGLVEMSEV